MYIRSYLKVYNTYIIIDQYIGAITFFQSLTPFSIFIEFDCCFYYQHDKNQNIIYSNYFQTDKQEG